MKKILILVLSVISVLSFVACAGGSTPPATTHQITVNQAVINIKPFETFDIVATYTGEEELQYLSSNTQIATVNGNGRVTGVSVGSAVITISAGETKKLCYVYVGENTEIPVITVLNAPENQVDIDLFSSYKLDLIATFDQEEIFVNYNYESLDSTIVSVKNGVLTANKVGSTQVYVTGSWRNFGPETLVAVIDVNVSNVSFSLNASEKNIYAVSTYAGKNYVNQTILTPNLKLNGVLINQGFTFESEDENIAVVSSNGIVTGKKVGKTRVYCKYTHGTEEIYSYIDLIVKAIDGGSVKGDMKDGSIAYLSKNVSEELLPGYVGDYVNGEDYSIKLPSTIVGEEILSLKIDNTEISNVEYDAIAKEILIPISEIQQIRSGDYEISVITNVGEFKSTITLADYVITNAVDFKVLQTASEGYYVLGADISGFDYAYKNVNQSPGFDGTFDGKGYSVSDLTHDSLSIALFATMKGNSCVKNVAFINMTYLSYHNCAMITNELYGGIIENIFLSGTTTGSSSLVNFGYNKAKINNCVVSVKCTRDAALVNCSIMKGMSTVGGESTVSNCYSATNYTGGVAPKAIDSFNYANENALLEGIGGVLPAGYNEYWSIKNGSLLFSGKTVVLLTKSLSGEKTLGELFYFSKDVTNPTGYANAYVENGYYKVAMPSSFTATSITELTIGGFAISNFSYANGVLKVATSEVSSIVNGVVDMIFVADSVGYQTKATVANLVLKTEKDLLLLTTLSNTSTDLIVLDGDITWTKTYEYERAQHLYATLDGKGYAIKDMVLGKAGGSSMTGLFITFQGGWVKNLAMLNVSFGTAVWRGGVLAGEVNMVNTDNVFISIAKYVGANGLVHTFAGGTSRINNTIVYYPSMTTTGTAGGFGATYGNSINVVVTNSFAVTTNGLIISTENTANTNVNYSEMNNLACANFDALKTASNNFANFSSTYWSIDKNGNLCFGDEVAISTQSK